MSKINELWILASKNGYNDGRSFIVVKKYLRRHGYSVRHVDMSFRGWMNSSKVQKFKDWSEVLLYLQDKHPTITNYGIAVSVQDVREAFERLFNEQPKAQAFWEEEYKSLKGVGE